MPQRDVPEFFAFYPYEFLSDENVLAMTLEQVGAYLLLIISQWINGSIPSEIPTLARLLKRNTGEMEILWAGLAPCFRAHPELPGRLIQPRVEAERIKALEAMATERARVKAYRERKRAQKISGAEGVAVSEERTCTDAVRNHDVNVPSTLLYSPLNTSTEERAKQRDANVSKWEEFKSLYPAHRLDEEPAARAWVSREEEADAILAGLRLVVTSEEWTRDGGKFVVKASRFISEGIYADAARQGNKPKEGKRRQYFDPRTITG